MRQRELPSGIDAVEQVLAERMQSGTEYRPQFFALGHAADRQRVGELVRNGTIRHVVDPMLDQEREYFQVLHPDWVGRPDFQARFAAYQESLNEIAPISQRGTWVFFPWLSTLVHILEAQQFFTVRTARNRGLVTVDEQRRFYDAIVGIAGLSVGNSVALAIVLSGGARHIKLADFDSLALSNTNRIRSGLENLGLKKVIVTARQIYLVNPYAKVDLFEDGLNQENIAAFMAGPPAIKVMIDEFDDLMIKRLVRQHARQYRIPVVTAHDIADTGVLDIERYDLDPETPFFHGTMGDLSQDMLQGLNKSDAARLIAMHVGPENAPPRLQEAFFRVGETLVSWPQLGGTALLNGSAVAYCVRRIVNNQSLELKRALISLDEKLIPDFSSVDERAKRDKATAKFKEQLGL